MQAMGRRRRMAIGDRISNALSLELRLQGQEMEAEASLTLAVSLSWKMLLAEDSGERDEDNEGDGDESHVSNEDGADDDGPDSRIWEARTLMMTPISKMTLKSIMTKIEETMLIMMEWVVWVMMIQKDEVEPSDDDGEPGTDER